MRYTQSSPEMLFPWKQLHMNLLGVGFGCFCCRCHGTSQWHHWDCCSNCWPWINQYYYSNQKCSNGRITHSFAWYVTCWCLLTQFSDLSNPFLCYTGGAAASILKGRGALQDIDQISLFKPLCKYVATVTSVRDIGPILKKAIQVAQSNTPGTISVEIKFSTEITVGFFSGPVFVEFPIDVLYPYELVKREVGAKNEGRGLINKVVNW